MRLTSQTFGQTMIFLTLLTGCKDLLPQSTSEELETKESGTETCASELSDRTYLRLSEDLSEQQSGLINFGDGLIEQLRIELLKTYPPETAVAIANSARNELDKHVGTLIIPEGTSIEPLGEVAAPVVRGAMFGLLDPCAGASSSEQGLGIAGHIVSGSTASLNGRTSELSAVETSEVIGSITNSSVKALPDVGLGGDLAAASVPALTKAAVASLPNAGVSDVIIKGSLQKIAQGATSALSTNGFDAQSVIAISGSVAGSAIAGLKDAGFSPEEIIETGAIGLIMSGSIAGLNSEGASANDLTSALTAVASGAVAALADAGFASLEFRKSALSDIIETSVEQSVVLANGSSDFISNALAEVASNVVASLREGGFESSQISDAISVVVEVGVSQLAEVGVTNAVDATSFSLKIISGAMEGAGQLLNDGIISADEATDSAKSANSGAIAGLESLEDAGVVSASASASFKSQISDSISAGLEQSGASAEVVAQAEQATKTEPKATAPAVTPVAETPTFSPANTSTFTTATAITLSSQTSGASIRYTLDGSTPTNNSGTLYTGPFTLRTSKTVKAIAYKSGYDNSQVGSIAYTLNVPTFSASTLHATGNNPVSVAAGDLNADGHTDLALGLWNGAGISLLRGNGDGTFNATQDILSPTVGGTSNTGMITIGDITNDGKPDLAWGSWGPNKAFFGKNSTAANATTFSLDGGAPAVLDTGVSAPLGVAFGDADLDGDKDLYISEYNSGWRMIIYQNDGTGTLTKFGTDFLINNSTTHSDNVAPRMIAVADLNGDAKLDAALGGSSAGVLSILLNGTTSAGTPVFNTASENPNYFKTSASPTSCTSHKFVSINDINGDGKKDIVTNCTGNSIAVFTNATAANSTTAAFNATSLATANNTNTVTTGDVDGDGNIDIVTATNTTVEFHKGNGNGTFAAGISFPITGASTSGDSQIILADVNGDSGLDVMVTMNGDDKVAVMLNQIAP